MSILHNKKPYSNFLSSILLFFVLSVAVVFLFRATWNLYGKYRESAEKKSEAASRLALLDKREAYINSEISYLNTKEGQEDEIRKKFSVIKEGESLAVIVEPKKDKIEEKIEDKNWFGKLVDKFASVFR